MTFASCGSHLRSFLVSRSWHPPINPGSKKSLGPRQLLSLPPHPSGRLGTKRLIRELSKLTFSFFLSFLFFFWASCFSGRFLLDLIASSPLRGFSRHLWRSTLFSFPLVFFRLLSPKLIKLKRKSKPLISIGFSWVYLLSFLPFLARLSASSGFRLFGLIAFGLLPLEPSLPSGVCYGSPKNGGKSKAKGTPARHPYLLSSSLSFRCSPPLTFCPAWAITSSDVTFGLADEEGI